ncbi:MAG: hypothetical protein FWD97_00320 [Defluviitaleaceae bacterium]|nr:hypothetical protein [Defluviitaleaceae bacterium]
MKVTETIQFLIEQRAYCLEMLMQDGMRAGEHYAQKAAWLSQILIGITAYPLVEGEVTGRMIMATGEIPYLKMAWDALEEVENLWRYYQTTGNDKWRQISLAHLGYEEFYTEAGRAAGYSGFGQVDDRLRELEKIVK